MKKMTFEDLSKLRDEAEGQIARTLQKYCAQLSTYLVQHPGSAPEIELDAMFSVHSVNNKADDVVLAHCHLITKVPL